MRITTLRALVVLIVVALATSGFAHRLSAPADPDALAFQAIFGSSFSDICGDSDETGTEQPCDACRLHACMELPKPAGELILAELALDPADWTADPPVLRTLISANARHARAPPIV